MPRPDENVVHSMKRELALIQNALKGYLEESVHADNRNSLNLKDLRKAARKLAALADFLQKD